MSVSGRPIDLWETTEWIAIQFEKAIHVPQGINPTDCGDLFPPVQPLGWHISPLGDNDYS